MALIEINPDLSRVADALERIAEALERGVPKLEPRAQPRLSDLGDYSRLTDADLIAREREKERQVRAYGEPADGGQEVG